ncbi:MAG: glycosyltransferase family 4 protein [Terriglobales bacterium]
MRTLKVAWDNSLAGRDKAGTGVYAARLLEQFAHRTDLSMQVLNGWRPVSPASGLLDRARGTVASMLWTHAYLPRRVGKMQVDLLHAPAFIAPALAAPCPVVVTVHDVTYLLFPSHFSRWWVTYLQIVMPPAIRSAAAIICGSEHSRRDIVKTYSISPDKVHVVPYGVDHERFHPGIRLDLNWARSLGIRAGYVLHVGSFSYRKNIPVLLRAIARLRSKGKWEDRQLVLAGSQDVSMKGAHEVFDTIRELDLNSVVLAGHVPEEHIPGLYAGAAALVIPSLYEGFGLPVLEAMAAGTPVVASNTSSLPEVAAGAAILFPPEDELALADAIEDVLENRSTANELRRNGLERARQFSWQRTAEETVAIYKASVSA